MIYGSTGPSPGTSRQETGETLPAVIGPYPLQDPVEIYDRPTAASEGDPYSLSENRTLAIARRERSPLQGPGQSLHQEDRRAYPQSTTPQALEIYTRTGRTSFLSPPLRDRGSIIDIWV
jgi:hypothetical protein